MPPPLPLCYGTRCVPSRQERSRSRGAKTRRQRGYARLAGLARQGITMPDVFISYSRRDSQFVSELADGLRSHGKEVWVDIDGLRDAEIFPVALRHAIEESDGFVFVISPSAVESAYCSREIADAVDAGKRIVPVDLKRVAADDLPEAIRVRNWIPVQADMSETV